MNLEIVVLIGIYEEAEDEEKDPKEDREVPKEVASVPNQNISLVGDVAQAHRSPSTQKVHLHEPFESPSCD